MKQITILVTILSLILSSCCSMTQNIDEKVFITSQPEGAAITIDGYNCGVTPQTVLLNKKQSHKVVIEKLGCQTQIFDLTSSTDIRNLSKNWGAAALCTTGLVAVPFLLLDNFAFGLIFIPLVGVAAGVGIACGIAGTGLDLYSKNSNKLSSNCIRAILKPDAKFSNSI